jgi:hypothetical protein
MKTKSVNFQRVSRCLRPVLVVLGFFALFTRVSFASAPSRLPHFAATPEQIVHAASHFAVGSGPEFIHFHTRPYRVFCVWFRAARFSSASEYGTYQFSERRNQWVLVDSDVVTQSTRGRHSMGTAELDREHGVITYFDTREFQFQSFRLRSQRQL